MPHVIVKMIPGRSEAQKRALSDAITKAVIEHAKSAEGDVSVAIEDVPDSEWMPKVYNLEIAPVLDKLYKKPDYGPE
ncbi:tautomerase family protein [Aestuariivirga litoralis]|uniref:tautomerase family protein n=1 Tax=Aestuariivirga litoralis TaxID=2650924 RepID=UPI0018C74FFC|nr:tautomerase family protein [Aestuariivirga litoralis]MBG1231758.1 4-oxalocrotonate tautomerase [Aestuariivirga litoralis]